MVLVTGFGFILLEFNVGTRPVHVFFTERLTFCCTPALYHPLSSPHDGPSQPSCNKLETFFSYVRASRASKSFDMCHNLVDLVRCLILDSSANQIGAGGQVRQSVGTFAQDDPFGRKVIFQVNVNGHGNETLEGQKCTICESYHPPN